jgi:hypothetical protein
MAAHYPESYTVTTVFFVDMPAFANSDILGFEHEAARQSSSCPFNGPTITQEHHVRTCADLCWIRSCAALGHGQAYRLPALGKHTVLMRRSAKHSVVAAVSEPFQSSQASSAYCPPLELSGQRISIAASHPCTAGSGTDYLASRYESWGQRSIPCAAQNIPHFFFREYCASRANIDQFLKKHSTWIKYMQVPANQLQ